MSITNDQIVVDRPSRSKTVSFKLLIESEEYLKGVLYDNIREVDDLKSSCDEDLLRKTIRNLRETHEKFRRISLDLSIFYEKNGSFSSVTEIDEDRRNLFGEYKLSYNKLNNRVRELGLTSASTVGDPSEYCSHAGNTEAGVSKAVYDWLSGVNPDGNINFDSSNEVTNVVPSQREGVILDSCVNNNVPFKNVNGSCASSSGSPPESLSLVVTQVPLIPCSLVTSTDKCLPSIHDETILPNVHNPEHIPDSSFGISLIGQVSIPCSSQTGAKPKLKNIHPLVHFDCDNRPVTSSSNIYDRPIPSLGKKIANLVLDKPTEHELGNRYSDERNMSGNGQQRNDYETGNRYPDKRNMSGNGQQLNNHVLGNRYSDERNMSGNGQQRNDIISGRNIPGNSLQCNPNEYSNECHRNRENFPRCSNFAPNEFSVADSNYRQRNDFNRNNSSNRQRHVDNSSIFPRTSSDLRSCDQSRRAPIQSEAVREYMRMDLLKGDNVHLQFDGTNPEDFWGWHEEINNKLTAAGFDPYPMEVIHALRVHTNKRPKELVTSYINAGIDDPEDTLREIWKTLVSRYGANDIVSNTVTTKISNIKKISHEDDKGSIDAMEDLHSLCLRIRRLGRRCDSLRHYSTPDGMKVLWSKMPPNFIKKWKAFYIEKQERGFSITFDHLLENIAKFIRIHSNPMFRKEITRDTRQAKSFFTATDDHNGNSSKQTKKSCSIHPDLDNHSLAECVVFKKYSYDDRRKHVMTNRLCFNCLGHHQAKTCKSKVKCFKCSGRHISLMHDDVYFKNISVQAGKETKKVPVPEQKEKSSTQFEKTKGLCTSIGEDGRRVKICSKTLPVQLRSSNGKTTLDCLAIIDEQSTHTFVDERVINLLDVPKENVKDNCYSLTTLERLNTTIKGSTVSGLEVKGLKTTKWIKLPPSLTHPDLPDTSAETAGPDLVRQHAHVRSFAKNFTEVDPTQEVMILIGANCGSAMFNRCYGSTYPYVHKTALGYALVGPTCVGIEDNSNVSVFKTSISSCEHYNVQTNLFSSPFKPRGSPDLFLQRLDDELPGASKYEELFQRIVSSGTTTNDKRKIEIPLPFIPDAKPPENKLAVYHRSNNTLARIKREPEKLAQCLTIMKDYLERGHVKQLSSAETQSIKTCLPIFAVSNERKGKTRLVFDSSAKYKGVSLNDCLLQGPDETNRLIGVLLRFRHNEVAFSADVETMFHCFSVPENQRKFQCFFWWKDNIPTNEIVPYSAGVHVFGHTSSPSVATYGLRYAAVSSKSSSVSARNFIHRNFYVDDGLSSEDTVAKAVNTLKEARSVLSEFNIRLHKIASTHSDVLTAFPASEIAKDVCYVDINMSSTQSALGIRWRIDSDEFHLDCKVKRTEFTKRGILSAIGSLYDPLGIAAPVGLTGKLLQRKFLQATANKNLDWDTELPEEFKEEWDTWVCQLHEVSKIKLRRSYRPKGFGPVLSSELHVFCDASEKSIGHVVYIRQLGHEGRVSVAFLYGSSRVAPKAATSIPRLELCAALAPLNLLNIPSVRT